MGSGGPHKDNPIPFRPPAGTDDRAWLIAHREATGKPINAILLQALREYRERAGGGHPVNLETAEP